MFIPYWRASPIVRRIKQAIHDNSCGELRSLRFTWQRPRRKASSSVDFLQQVLAAAIDAAELLGDSRARALAVQQVSGRNNLFALLQLENGITAEYELNETLPETYPDVCFVKANFSHGHVTNQPLVGHFNEEGMVLADDRALQCCLIAETSRCPPVDGVIAQMQLDYELKPVSIDVDAAAAILALIREVTHA